MTIIKKKITSKRLDDSINIVIKYRAQIILQLQYIFTKFQILCQNCMIIGFVILK